MRKFMAGIAAAALATAAGAKDPGFSHKLYGEVLEKAERNGRVDYVRLKSDPEPLGRYLKSAAAASRRDFDAWPRAERLAFLINLYNASVLRLAADNYPLKSIKDIPRAFQRRSVNLFGREISLDELENDWIRKTYNEPRIHFALVCAAKSCPPLRGEPYAAAALEKQLEEQTRAFLSDKRMNYLDPGGRVLYLSPYFDWFQEDFTRAAGSAADFLRPYFGTQTASGLKEGRIKMKYVPYDWSLNEAGPGF
jgi:hypothetical protein